MDINILSATLLVRIHNSEIQWKPYHDSDNEIKKRKLPPNMVPHGSLGLGNCFGRGICRLQLHDRRTLLYRDHAL